VKALAVDLDAVLGDTRPLFAAWLEDASRRARVELGPDSLDERLPNWRPLLERFAEEHAPVYLRPRGEANAALRSLRAAGVRVGAFTGSPEPLARVALAQLGAARHVDVLECGDGARERLLAALGEGTRVAETTAGLALESEHGA
jgi:phosphoglycolate phosphatase-like HAD superfamily hydrolase